VFAYFDETTGGDKNDKLEAVAGYLFDVDGVSHFLKRYREYVEPLIPIRTRGKRIGQKIFHASSCFDGSDEYFGIKREIREAIMGRMATVIAESVTVGAVIAVEHEQYRLGRRGRYMQVDIQGQPRSNDLAPWIGSMYSMCLHRCIDSLNQWLGAERPDASGIEYVIEQGAAHQEEATQVLDRIASNEKLKARYRWRSHKFIEKTAENPWLFAPDFYAWEWQRYDRLVEEGRAEKERSLLQPALDAKPHLAMYLMEAAVNTNAVINAFYGLVRPPKRG
jgi:hypothetical protein